MVVSLVQLGGLNFSWKVKETSVISFGRQGKTPSGNDVHEVHKIRQSPDLEAPDWPFHNFRASRSGNWRISQLYSLKIRISIIFMYIMNGVNGTFTILGIRNVVRLILKLQRCERVAV